MINLLAATALLALAWWVSRTLAGSDAAARTRWLKRAGGIALGVGALVLVLRGRLDMALLVASLAAPLVAAGPGGPLARLQAYLDRRLPGRREHAERDLHARMRPPPAMTEEQAYQTLGLAPGADAEAVLSSHRRLVKRVHPDSGGSDELAARVNQARDVLLSRHR